MVHLLSVTILKIYYNISFHDPKFSGVSVEHNSQIQPMAMFLLPIVGY
jgi:hypothetical protein